jgi:formylglycine-generating enzyme required for sulfatase activity
MRPFATPLITAALVAALVSPVTAVTLKCTPDAVQVGPTCVDKYEESVWQVPATNLVLLKKIRAGKVTLADLTGGGATQVSLAPECTPSFPATFPSTGNWTAPLYAVSVPGVIPTACATWFQAEQACALSGKRLLTNQEWQRAAAGTPDPGTDDGSTQCNISATGAPSNTGARSACVSKWGAFDMVGNVVEWVAEWGDQAANCSNWSAAFGNDQTCVGGPAPSASSIPGGVLRGGSCYDGANAGVFAIFAVDPPYFAHDGGGFGFRCGH